MKVFTAIVKIAVALAAIAGAAYLLATYGDKLIAWAKKLCGCCGCCEVEEIPAEEPVEEVVEAPVEEEPVAEVPVEEPTDAPAIPAEDPVAEDQDFAD